MSKEIWIRTEGMDDKDEVRLEVPCGDKHYISDIRVLALEKLDFGDDVKEGELVVRTLDGEVLKTRMRVRDLPEELDTLIIGNLQKRPLEARTPPPKVEAKPVAAAALPPAALQPAPLPPAAIQPAAIAAAASQAAPATAKQGLCVDAHVTVTTEFKSDSLTHTALRAGLQGTVKKVDKAGDLLIDFDQLPPQWVKQCNFAHITVEQPQGELAHAQPPGSPVAPAGSAAGPVVSAVPAADAAQSGAAPYCDDDDAPPGTVFVVYIDRVAADLADACLRAAVREHVGPVVALEVIRSGVSEEARADHFAHAYAFAYLTARPRVACHMGHSHQIEVSHAVPPPDTDTADTDAGSVAHLGPGEHIVWQEKVRVQATTKKRTVPEPRDPRETIHVRVYARRSSGWSQRVESIQWAGFLALIEATHDGEGDSGGPTDYIEIIADDKQVKKSNSHAKMLRCGFFVECKSPADGERLKDAVDDKRVCCNGVTFLFQCEYTVKRKKLYDRCARRDVYNEFYNQCQLRYRKALSKAREVVQNARTSASAGAMAVEQMMALDGGFFMFEDTDNSEAAAAAALDMPEDLDAVSPRKPLGDEELLPPPQFPCGPHMWAHQPPLGWLGLSLLANQMRTLQTTQPQPQTIHTIAAELDDAESYQAKVAAVAELESLVRGCEEPPGAPPPEPFARARLRLFGSTATGLARRGDDLDIAFLVGDDDPYSDDAAEWVRALCIALKYGRGFAGALYVQHVRVPIMRNRPTTVEDAGVRGMVFDVSFQGSRGCRGLRNSALLRAYVASSPAIRVAAVVAKEWSRGAGVSAPYDEGAVCPACGEQTCAMGLSRYAVVLLFLHFCTRHQHAAWIPPSQFQCADDAPPPIAAVSPADKKDAARLLDGFWRFYASEFRWGEEIADLASPPQEGPLQAPPLLSSAAPWLVGRCHAAIADPYELHPQGGGLWGRVNLGRHVCAAKAASVRAAFEHAAADSLGQ